MKLTVITNTLNEGPRVRSTCENFLSAGADEIIVCADGTTDGSCDNLPPQVTVIRHTTAQGCGKAKLAATAVSTGDVMMWVDAHQSVLDGDIRQMAADVLAHDTIMCPALRNIYYDDQWQSHVVENSTRLFYPNDEAILPLHTNQYRYANPETSIMVGVGLCMSRRTYLRVGGWNRFIGRHGSQERGMALRAYMANVPVVIDPAVVLGHEFFGETHPSRNRQTGQYRFNNIVPAMANVWHSYFAVCSPAGFRSYFHPWFSTYKNAKDGEAILTHPDIIADHEYFHRHCKRRPDAELFAIVESWLATQEAPQDTGTAALEPSAVRIIAAYAQGRCLEFGTGTGRGTKILLQAGMHVVSVDHLEQFTNAAKTTIVNDRVDFRYCPRATDTGFYDVTELIGLFDCVVLDGPPGTAARKRGIAQTLPYLAPGGFILVDDANRDKSNIESAAQEYQLTVEYLPTKRGLAKVYKKL